MVKPEHASLIGKWLDLQPATCFPTLARRNKSTIDSRTILYFGINLVAIMHFQIGGGSIRRGQCSRLE